MELSRSNKIILTSCAAAVLLAVGVKVYAQRHNQASNSTSPMRYNIQIDIDKAYISGIAIFVKEGRTIKANIINEFGATLIYFTYDTGKKKVLELQCSGKLNKWYIRKMMKNDMSVVMQQFGNESMTYTNKAHDITYKLTLMTEEAEAANDEVAE